MTGKGVSLSFCSISLCETVERVGYLISMCGFLVYTGMLSWSRQYAELQIVLYAA
jgi:hypothetical protein